MATAADLNGDGRAELLWRNTSTGANAIWYMNGTTIESTGTLPTADANWSLVAARDLNADGKIDLIWRNKTSGENAVWFMNGASIASQASLLTVSDTNWSIIR